MTTEAGTRRTTFPLSDRRLRRSLLDGLRVLVALLAIVALAVDLGMAYSAHAEAQRTADAAALAAASAFRDLIDVAEAVPEAERRDLLQQLLASAGSSAARQALIEGYLRSFEPGQQQAKAQELHGIYEDAPDESSSTLWANVFSDLQAVMSKMELGAGS